MRKLEKKRLEYNITRLQDSHAGLTNLRVTDPDTSRSASSIGLFKVGSLRTLIRFLEAMSDDVFVSLFSLRVATTCANQMYVGPRQGQIPWCH